MKKIYLLLICTLCSAALTAQDIGSQIGQKGDSTWTNLMTELKAAGKLLDPPLGAGVLAANPQNYLGKSMIFPGFDFSDFVTDESGEKYYYYGEKESFSFFVIKYDQRITDLLRTYAYAVGPVGTEGWQLLGTVKEVYSRWGNVVAMDIKALRVAGKATIILQNGKLDFVASELITRLMDEKAAAGLGDVPKGLSVLPTGLDPLVAAKLYVQLGAVEKNEALWLKLLAPGNFTRNQPDIKVRTWWNNLNRPNRTYFFVRTAEDTPELKKYFFQIRENGADLGSPKPMTLTLHGGEWKVESGL